jgi:hypothetical protein
MHVQMPQKTLELPGSHEQCAQELDIAVSDTIFLELV